MRKNVKKVIAPLLAAAMALSCTVCVSAAEDETIKLTVWGAEEDQNLLKELTDKFQEKYADQKFDIQIGVESESTAKDTILTDVEAGADVYAFADDQLPDLVKAGALLKLDDYAEALQLADTTLDDVKAANVEGAIDAATIDGSLYAFPRAADNGYFLYYDSSVISEEDAASWDSLLEAADKAGKKVGMTLASGWYNASFFYGAGFTTGLNDDGTTTMDWNGTSADGYTGVDVVKGMLDITSNPAFMAVADGDMSNQLASGNLAACVSGTWDAESVKEALGDNMGVAALPTVNIGGTEGQMKSFVGSKAIGVNPNAENMQVAMSLAAFLAGENAQKDHYDMRNILPTNINIAIADDPIATAVTKVMTDTSIMQPLVSTMGNYWSPAENMGKALVAGEITADNAAEKTEAMNTAMNTDAAQ